MKSKDLVFYEVILKETDLMIGTPVKLYTQALEAVKTVRCQIEEYISKRPEFLKSLTPLEDDPSAVPVIRKMLLASEKAGVGPMAAVAGAVSEEVGNVLLEFCDNVIIENGGDIFIKSTKVRKAGVFAGNSPLSEKIAVVIEPDNTPMGICTSSGTVGHSLSFGKADAVCVAAVAAALADAAATAICNRVSAPSDFEAALDFADSIKGLEGVLIIIGDAFTAKGNIRLAPF